MSVHAIASGPAGYSRLHSNSVFNQFEQRLTPHSPIATEGDAFVLQALQYDREPAPQKPQNTQMSGDRKTELYAKGGRKILQFLGFMLGGAALALTAAGVGANIAGISMVLGAAAMVLTGKIMLVWGLANLVQGLLTKSK